jgi:hypothetical protein
MLSYRLLKARHFAEGEAWGGILTVGVPMVYERRSKCKLKRSQNARVANPAKNSKQKGLRK